MSKELIIKVRDDIDGSDAAETISFAYRGVDYEIDLSEANVDLFDKSMAPFIEGARRIVAEKRSPASRARAVVPEREVKEQRARIRAWARNKGIPISSRGVIAASVIEAYLVDHPTEKLIEAPPEPAVSVTASQVARSGGSVTSLMGAKGTNRSHRASSPMSKEQRDAIRAWAVGNGYHQSGSGYLRREVLDAYYAAHHGVKEG